MTTIESKRSQNSGNHFQGSWYKKPKKALRKIIRSTKLDMSVPPLVRTTALVQGKEDILKMSKKLMSLMTLAEHKVSIPRYRGTDAPTVLDIPHSGSIPLETKESQLFADTVRSLFRDKHYTFRLSTALNMSSSGAGAVNSTISNSTLASQVDFVSLSTVFNEFFVKSFTVDWEPVSLYNYPLGGTSTLSVSSLPLGGANLQHGQAAYTSLSLMSDNFEYRYHNTGRKFSQTWSNTESITDTTLASLTAPTQSWCTTNNVSNYQGTLQFLSQAAPPALPFSQVLGTFTVHWFVHFRVRA